MQSCLVSLPVDSFHRGARLRLMPQAELTRIAVRRVRGREVPLAKRTIRPPGLHPLVGSERCAEDALRSSKGSFAPAAEHVPDLDDPISRTIVQLMGGDERLAERAEANGRRH